MAFLLDVAVTLTFFFVAAEPHGNSSKLSIGGRGRVRCGPVVIQTLFLTSLLHQTLVKASPFGRTKQELIISMRKVLKCDFILLM